MIEFKQVKEEHLQLILDWRTSESITTYMKTDIPKDIEKQKAWYREKIENQHDVKHWVIFCENQPIGFTSIHDDKLTTDSLSWGFYIGNLSYKYLSGLIPLYFYNYIFMKFSELKFIYGEVLSNNDRMLKIHSMHGCTFLPRLRGAVKKNNEILDAVPIMLTRETWNNMPKIFREFKASFYEYS
mgnify:CR=1 FL=1